MGKRGKKPMIVPQELKDTIIRDFRRGHSITELINIHGLSRKRITKILKENGETITVGRKKGGSELLYENVRQAYKGGLDVKAIMRKYKISRSSAYAILTQDDTLNDSRVTYKTNRIMQDINDGGLTLSEIARMYGLTRQRVHQIKEWMRKNERLNGDTQN